MSVKIKGKVYDAAITYIFGRQMEVQGLNIFFPRTAATLPTIEKLITGADAVELLADDGVTVKGKYYFTAITSIEPTTDAQGTQLYKVSVAVGAVGQDRAEELEAEVQALTDQLSAAEAGLADANSVIDELLEIIGNLPESYGPGIEDSEEETE